MKLADKTFFVETNDDSDIEMSGDSMDESEDKSIDSDDDNLFGDDEKDKKAQRRVRLDKGYVNHVADVIV